MLFLPMSKKADPLFLAEYLNFLLGEVLICHNGRLWFDSRFRYPCFVNWDWDSLNLLSDHYPIVSRARFTSHAYYCHIILRCQHHENDLTLGRQNGKQRCRERHFPSVFFVTLHVSLAFMLICCTLLS
jgi:hypothetical protein